MVPPLWRSEFLSALAKFVRAGLTDSPHALEAFRRAERRLVEVEQSPSAARGLRLVETYPKLSTYDAEFVALAEEFGGVVLTNDERTLASRVPEHLVVKLSSLA